MSTRKITRQEKDVRKIIAREGAEVVGADITGGNHLKFRIRVDDTESTMIASRSPSDFRAMKNVRSHVRRLVRGQS